MNDLNSKILTLWIWLFLAMSFSRHKRHWRTSRFSSSSNSIQYWMASSCSDCGKYVTTSISVCESLLVIKHSGNSRKYCLRISAASMAIVSVQLVFRLAKAGDSRLADSLESSLTRSDLDVDCELNSLPLILCWSIPEAITVVVKPGERWIHKD